VAYICPEEEGEDIVPLLKDLSCALIGRNFSGAGSRAIVTSIQVQDADTRTREEVEREGAHELRMGDVGDVVRGVP